jgi:hypothetical protein
LGGSINSVFRKEYSTKSHASFTRLCPDPSYRATYHRNSIIYKIFRICQGVSGGKCLFSDFIQIGRIFIKITR